MEFSSALHDPVMKKINQLNLDPVIERLVKLYSWSRSNATELSEYYKHFLFLQYKYGDQYSLSPSKEIDEFWHNHILFTKQYQHDCEAVFGKFLHHRPFTEEDQQKIKASGKNPFDIIQKLHLEEFGEYIYDVRLMLGRRFLKAFFCWPWWVMKKIAGAVHLGANHS